MARVFRHSYTAKGPDGRRVKRICAKWYIEFTGVSGRVRRVPGYTDKRATEAKAAELQRAVDREKAGIIDQQSLDLSRQLATPIAEHIEAYRVHLHAAGVSEWHRSETLRRLDAVTKSCGLASLSDIRAEPVQRWCGLREAKGMSARTRNTYKGSLRAFVRWCIADGRLAADPLVTLGRADEAANVQRRRRALTEDELSRLLHVAGLRPLAEYGRKAQAKAKSEIKGKRDTWTKAALTIETIDAAGMRARERLQRKPMFVARLERQGRERGLIYRTLVLTGLRRGELAGLTWGDLTLDGPEVWLTVRAGLAKNRKAESVPVRTDLADLLRQWRAESGNPSDREAVFNVPKGLVRILDRDLGAAGIPKVDDDGRRIDVHALRHTTATYLAKAGVAPRTAQSIMRHSDIRLTLGTYTDPRLLDQAAALEALPHFTPDPQRKPMRATGTTDDRPETLGVLLGGNVRPDVQKRSSACADNATNRRCASPAQVLVNSQVSNDVQHDSSKRATGLEPATFSLEG